MFENIGDKILKYLPYLEDIQRRVYRMTILFVITFFAGFSFSGPIIRFLLKIFNIEGVLVATTSPFQLANLSMDIGLFCAVAVVIPVIVFHFFSFASSALTNREKNNLLIYIPVSVFLFIMGFAYSFLILYYSFGLFAAFGNTIGVKNIWDIGQFISQTYMTALLLGFIFQVPLLLTGLIRFGFLNVDFLRKKRRIAWVFIVILVSLLPPTDGLSLLAMSLPLVLLYEASIFINRNV